MRASGAGVRVVGNRPGVAAEQAGQAFFADPPVPAIDEALCIELFPDPGPA